MGVDSIHVFVLFTLVISIAIQYFHDTHIMTRRRFFSAPNFFPNHRIFRPKFHSANWLNCAKIKSQNKPTRDKKSGRNCVFCNWNVCNAHVQMHERGTKYLTNWLMFVNFLLFFCTFFLNDGLIFINRTSILCWL